MPGNRWFLSAILGTALIVAATAGPTTAQRGTPCGPAPAGYNVIVSDAPEIVGTVADDFICAGDSPNVIGGGEGDDIIHAGGGADVVHGQGGNDRIFGEGGADRLNGDVGTDIVRGGPGADIIHGGRHDDRLSGGANDDVLYGDSGNDSLHGRRGDDLLVGASGNDRLRGGLGRDILRGSGDNDVLQGNAGPDLLWGGGGRDILDGRRGQDHCVPARRMISCENGQPVGDHRVQVRFIQSRGELDGGGWSVGSWEPLHTFPFPPPTFTPSAPVLVFVWQDASRSELLGWYDEMTSSGDAWWLISSEYGSFSVGVDAPPRGAVIDVLDGATGFGTSVELYLTTELALGSAPGVVGEARSDNLVTVVEWDVAMAAQIESTVVAGPDGDFFVPLPSVGLTQSTIDVWSEDEQGNRNLWRWFPAAQPLLGYQFPFAVDGHGGWTPNGSVEIRINDEVDRLVTSGDAGTFHFADREWPTIESLGGIGAPVTVSATDLVSGITKTTTLQLDLEPVEVLGGGTIRLRGQTLPGTAVTKHGGLVREAVATDAAGRFSTVIDVGDRFLISGFDEDGDNWSVYVECPQDVIEATGTCFY